MELKRGQTYSNIALSARITHFGFAKHSDHSALELMRFYNIRYVARRPSLDLDGVSKRLREL